VPLVPAVPDVPPPTINDASNQVPAPEEFIFCDVGLPVKAVTSK
jgi:hypothetical protein